MVGQASRANWCAAGVWRGDQDGFAGELNARESEKAAILGSLNKQIREKEDALAKVTTAYDEFRKSHGMLV